MGNMISIIIGIALVVSSILIIFRSVRRQVEGNGCIGCSGCSQASSCKLSKNTNQ